MSQLFQNTEVWNDYRRTCYRTSRPRPTASFRHA